MKYDGGVITSQARSELSKQEKKLVKKPKKKAAKAIRKAAAVKCRRIYADVEGPIDFTEVDEPFPIQEDPEKELTGCLRSFGSPEPLERAWEESVPSRYVERFRIF